LHNKEERKKRREIRAKEHEEKMLAFKQIQNLIERSLETKDKN